MPFPAIQLFCSRDALLCPLVLRLDVRALVRTANCVLEAVFVSDVPSAAALLCAGGCLILDVPSAATLGIGVPEFMTRLFSPNLEKGVIISQLPNSEVFTPYPAFCLYKNTVVL